MSMPPSTLTISRTTEPAGVATSMKYAKAPFDTWSNPMDQAQTIVPCSTNGEWCIRIEVGNAQNTYDIIYTASANNPYEE